MERPRTSDTGRSRLSPIRSPALSRSGSPRSSGASSPRSHAEEEEDGAEGVGLTDSPPRDGPVTKLTFANGCTYEGEVVVDTVVRACPLPHPPHTTHVALTFNTNVHMHTCT